MTQNKIRASFWDAFPKLEKTARQNKTKSKGQNAQSTDTRTAFVDYLDSLQKAGVISEKTAFNATL